MTTAPTVDLTPAPGDASIGAGSSSSSGAAASSCHPSDVLTFVEGPYRPAATPSGACLDGDGGAIWDDFYDACLGPNKTSDSCTTFKQAPENAACAACVLTPATADQLGPVLSFGEFVGGNLAGCIELTTPSDTSCATAVQARSDCETAACEANCPVTDPTSLAARQQCVMDADQAGCLIEFDNANNCTDAGLAAPCMNSGFKEFYDEVVPLFCGQTPAVDAGTAAVADAAAGDAAIDIDGEPPAAPDAGSD